jgi:two-component system sensor histidine kinase VicK
MRGRRLFSVRWWLALAFAAVAVITALAVAQVSRSQSESALRAKAGELAAGSAVAAAARITASTIETPLAEATAVEAARRRVALFVFDRSGTLVTAPRSQGVRVAAVPGVTELLARALGGERVVEGVDGGQRITVALPLRRPETGALEGALVAVASRPDLVAAVSVVRDTILVAAGWAMLIGILAGVLVSVPITRRVRRISTAAAAIEQGQFDQELQPRFPDELGDLGRAIDTMQQELRRSFDQLGAERDRVRTLIEQLQEGVIGVDRSLRVVIANRRASEILGRSVADGDALPEPWPATSLSSFVRRLFREDTAPSRLRVVPAEDHVLDVTGLPAAPGADFAVLVVSDVTQRERRERAEREFVANAAHELRTPLTAIASAVEVLQNGAKDDPVERDRFLAAVQRQTLRLERLVRALLTLARAQTNGGSVGIEAVALAPLLREVVQDQGLEPACLDVDEHAVALAHPELLRQAVENLIGNARKHAGGEGLRVRARLADPETAVVEVADTGPGMSREQAERVVDRFFRGGDRGADGFGLGLSIAREVARAVGGRLELETNPDVGTTVRLRLMAQRNGG